MYRSNNHPYIRMGRPWGRWKLLLMDKSLAVAVEGPSFRRVDKPHHEPLDPRLALHPARAVLAIPVIPVVQPHLEDPVGPLAPADLRLPVGLARLEFPGVLQGLAVPEHLAVRLAPSGRCYLVILADPSGLSNPLGLAHLAVLVLLGGQLRLVVLAHPADLVVLLRRQ